VLVTLNDKKLGVSSNNNTVDYFNPQIVSAQDYYPFGMLQPGRSVNAGGYRYGFNGQERSTEMNDNSYTAEFWEYDCRIGRRWNLDPSPVDGISSYSAFLNNPNLFKDPLGDTSKFFGNDGVLMYQNNKGKTMNLYVVVKEQFNSLNSKFKNKDKLTSELVKIGLKAFDNQDDAAADWAPGGFEATIKNNLERAARIFRTKAFGDQSVPYLFLVGTTVEGRVSNEPGVSQQTDPDGSKVTLNGKDISEYKSTNTVTTRRGNVIVSKTQITYSNWQVSAMIHTHNAGHDKYSISNPVELGGTYSGDYGIAADGISVYLVPTNKLGSAYRMFRLDLGPEDRTMYFRSTHAGQDYMEQQKRTIYMSKGKILPPSR
jgi:RHS repeat-associated protein